MPMSNPTASHRPRTLRACALVCVAICLALCVFVGLAFTHNPTASAESASSATSVPQVETPEYKVAFYPYANYHIEDENGVKSGYGYEMMQDLSHYMQCTFDYVGYDKTTDECMAMLRDGQLDLYTASRINDERRNEFAVSKHPAITATTSMNVKVGNTKVVAGDYSTYNGLRIGLLARHTYNDAFLEFVREKGFDCTITYYNTPAELTNALVEGDVDALVNSYIRTPEDEQVVEEFGETPYYIIARKSDQALIDQVDAAMDALSVESPNWRTDLYNKYYGAADKNTDLSDSEQALLAQMRDNGTVIRAVADPDDNPYSWVDDGQAKGMAVDLFKATADRLGLKYEIVPVSTRQEYLDALDAGAVDVWMDVDYRYEEGSGAKYRITDPYMDTTVSVLRSRDSSGRAQKLAVVDYNATVKELLAENWSDVEVVQVNSTDECVSLIRSGQVDGALMLTYTAQRLAKDDLQNTLQADILPGATLQLRMGVNANDNRDFYGIWEKTLYQVAEAQRASITLSHLEDTETPSPLAYMFNHPALLVCAAVLVLLVLFLALMYVQSSRSRRRYQRISDELAVALGDAEEATEAKQNFFSKMSHDIRTPLNVVLGMTQIAQNCKTDPEKLGNALDSITSEGNYLLMLINSILDVNQLEHGTVELRNEPFNPAACIRGTVDMMRPLAIKRSQTLTFSCNNKDAVVVGDAGRFGQVAMNIVSNAVKYTNTGGSINVELECLDNGTCRFTCSDNGIGMDPEFVDHMTEDYVRAEDSRVSKVQGTGLGMSVVKGFTDLMGGTLEVRSEKGIGSTFVVEVPFEPATPQQRDAVLAHAVAPEGYDGEFNGKKALLAEDNALNAEIAMELLSSLGLAIDWAEDGKQAVERFENSRLGEYAMVFMDMQMPVMDGLEATRAIRASHRQDNDIPIFAMTANTFVSDRNRCAEAGMNGFIPKPIDLGEITNTIKGGIQE